jgi:MOSC domain-containing protein YiiM
MGMRGWYAKVLEGGMIQVGSSVSPVLEAAL